MFKDVAVIRRCEQSYFRRCMEAHGLMPFDGMVLHLFSEHPSSNQDTLCERLLVDKSRIAKAVTHLEERGLVLREINPLNRRENRVTLTPAGLGMLAHIEQAITQWRDICCTGFTAAERAAYIGFIARAAANVEAYQRHLGGK